MVGAVACMESSACREAPRLASDPGRYIRPPGHVNVVSQRTLGGAGVAICSCAGHPFPPARSIVVFIRVPRTERACPVMTCISRWMECAGMACHLFTLYDGGYECVWLRHGLLREGILNPDNTKRDCSDHGKRLCKPTTSSVHVAGCASALS